MCKFKHLEFNEAAELFNKKAVCLECGESFALHDKYAIYGGHEEYDGVKYDVFSMSHMVVCPNCGEQMGLYREVCASGTRGRVDK